MSDSRAITRLTLMPATTGVARPASSAGGIVRRYRLARVTSEAALRHERDEKPKR